jgi:hypothetical protein
MLYSKRLWIALFFGVLAGLACGFMSRSGVKPELMNMVFLSAFLNRVLIGFLIGVSCWRVGWILHGILMGFIGSLPLAIPLIITPDGGLTIALMYIVAGIVWGFLIELFTTVVFKAPMKTA